LGTVQAYLAVLDEGTVGLEDDEATVHVLQQVEFALQDDLHVVFRCKWLEKFTKNLAKPLIVFCSVADP
jgi:hypothetical protein